MNRKKILSAALVFMFLLVSFWLSAEESKNNPVAVSPGSDTETVSVWQSCPTFSWSAVEQASSYRIAVFEVVDPKVTSYEEMAAVTSPLISKDIPGPALSWTLSSEKSLKTGSMYAWYVQAVDVYGNALGSWSKGRIFKVKQEVRFAGIEEKLSEKLREYGVNEETITNVLKDIKSEVKEVVVRSEGSKELSNDTQGRRGIQVFELSNTFYGSGAGAKTTGYWNSFFGYNSGFFNTIGASNTFIGSYVGYYNTQGNENTFIGSDAGHSNTQGDYNTFIGSGAGYSMTSGQFNIFIGKNAGFSCPTSFENIFIGDEAGKNNTSGEFNIFIGRYAGNANTTGGSNTIIGTLAGENQTTGGHNSFIGSSAGRGNTTGSINTFLGNGAGQSNTTGGSNVFIGYTSGSHNTTSNCNTYIGERAGCFSTGYGNVFLGNKAGYNETGSNKLYISNTTTSSPLIYGEFDNNIVTINGKLGIGTITPDYPIELETTGTNACFVVKRTDGATNYINATDQYANFGSVANHPLRLVVNSTWRLRLNSDNSLSMASGATCTAGGTWTNASSRDLKENIENLRTDEAMDALNRLNPVKYNYKVDKTDRHVGFIAEDVPEIVATAGRKGLSPMDITAVLTRVVQEQQKLIREQQQVNRKYKKIISDLQERIANIEKER